MSRSTSAVAASGPADEVDGADHGLDGSRRGSTTSRRRRSSSSPRPSRMCGAEADHARDLGERDDRHEAGPPLRELALVEAGILAVEHHRHGLPEDRVAEELEALVVGRARRSRRRTSGGSAPARAARGSTEMPSFAAQCSEAPVRSRTPACGSGASHGSDVRDLTALVLQVQGRAGGVFDHLGAVREGCRWSCRSRSSSRSWTGVAFHCERRACVFAARLLALGNGHDDLSLLVTSALSPNVVSAVGALREALQSRPPRVEHLFGLSLMIVREAAHP